MKIKSLQASPTMNFSAQSKHFANSEEIGILKERLERLNSHDQDSGLLNHEALLGIMNAEIAKAGPHPSCAAFIEIRINGLSRIGEVYGRKAIGSVIRQLAERLERASIANRIIGRIDHKSFGIFLPKVDDPIMALQTAKELVALCERPMPWGEKSLMVEAIAGVALTSEADRDATALLHNAGLALRASSEIGSPGYSFYNPADAPIAKRKNDLIGIITQAVEREQFELVYQPFFDFQTGGLAGFETLMRLKHPEFGAIPPAEFIPIVEEIGLISRLGAWCMEEACRTASTWPSHLVVAVNFSPAQFYTGTLLKEVHLALQNAQFPAYRLEVEITEGTLLSDQELVLSQLKAMSDMGCSIALDDFGTGYSSLSYLWQFPFSKLKIDRSFIHALDTTPKAPGILRSIIDLSRNLGLKVTAEGIETMEQMVALRNLKCDYLQGYLCGRPTAKSNLAAIILKNFSEMLRINSEPGPAIELRPGLKQAG
jgi:EAL domain-containing protein (putative c-di-GMP-specific phosphodiesterase class I)/GGDEF domain-containing protein